jgi:3-hydroxy-9,10-secoandrosta-1,3,5(10)-triene-9,17-dione monooxygenase reductase component
MVQSVSKCGKLQPRRAPRTSARATGPGPRGGHWLTALMSSSSGPHQEAWPSRELIDSYLGTGFDFELRLGEHTPLPVDDPAAAEGARRFRDVLGMFATGVTVVTSMSGNEPVGMTCQSFSSVSLDPPLVMFCPARTSRAWPLMREAGFFCVNFLSADQQHISTGMASTGAEKFHGVGWKPASTGAPLIDGVLGYVDCTIDRVHEAGDHYIVVGRVEQLDIGDGTEQALAAESPLLFHRGAYTRPK